jgi:H+/Cl- antiporter ClcA
MSPSPNQPGQEPLHARNAGPPTPDTAGERRSSRLPDRATVRRPIAVEAVRRLALATASGVLAGLACWVFLTTLDRATEFRLAHAWMLWLLPVAGLGIGASYHLFGGEAGRGNALLLEQIHDPTEWVPRRMAPLVAVGTVVSHLFGASVGREGTALQMSGSLTDLLARTLHLDNEDRRWLLVVALGGGFGAVFGVPWAGAAFGIEVQSIRRAGRHRARRALDLLRAWHRSRSSRSISVPPPGTSTSTLAAVVRRIVGWVGRAVALVVPVLVASFVGDAIVRGLGDDHGGRQIQLHPVITAPTLARMAVLGVAFGLGAIAFIEGTDLVRHLVRRVDWPPLRPVLGGFAVLAVVAVAGRDELGLSLPLISQSLSGAHVSLAVPLLKIGLTAICLGTAYVGGEVTPLFVVGATIGASVAPALGLDPVVGAGVGFVAAFAGATNTPIACTIMGMELFGPGLFLPLVVGCWVSYWCSGGRGIYGTQRIATADGHDLVDARHAFAHRLTRRWSTA